MSKNRVIGFKTPVPEVADPLGELLRTGAQKLIASAVEAQFGELLNQYAGRLDEQGRRVLVLSGYLPEREIQTGLGPVKARVPRAPDRGGGQGSSSTRGCCRPI